MKSGVQVPHPIEVLCGYGTSFACGLDGQVFADKLHGLFAGDTRVLDLPSGDWRIVNQAGINASVTCSHE